MISQALLRMPRIGYGCVRLSTCKTFSKAKEIINCALANGIRYFDTAPSYGRGYSERILGACLASSNLHRNEYIIATKLGAWNQLNVIIPPIIALPIKELSRRIAAYRNSPTDKDNSTNRVVLSKYISEHKISVEQVKTSFQRSIIALRTSYIDILLLHEALPSFLTKQAHEYLFSLKQSGQVKYIGIAANGSNYKNLSQAQLAGWDILQYEYGPSWPNHYIFKDQFPLMHHVVHSCIGKCGLGVQAPSIALEKTLTSLPNCTVLFSSLNPNHIKENTFISKDKCE